MRTPGALDGNDRPFPERQLRSAKVLEHPNRRPVVDPEGRVYPSLGDAARAYRLTNPTVRHRATLGLAGWRFAEPAPIPGKHHR